MNQLNNDGSFQMDDFQNKAPFSSFLPGIAGARGIPAWAFYVNRGQGIASFGVQDKDHAIMEFHPADKSYQHVYQQGFRTFLNVHDEDGDVFVEPFAIEGAVSEQVKESMQIHDNALKLTYSHETVGLEMTVTYTALPESKVGALMRHVDLTNKTDRPVHVELLDGMPRVMPSGVSNAAYKELGNTLKSWFDVEEASWSVPFYTLRGSMDDSAEVREIPAGNFYSTLVKTETGIHQPVPVVDPGLVFGTDTSLTLPKGFLGGFQAPETIEEQTVTNKVACGFTHLDISLEPGSSVSWISVTGSGKNKETVAGFISETFNFDELLAKEARAMALVKEMTDTVSAKTAHPVFDSYARQNYLDNGLRGGFPVAYGSEPGQIFYLFSRKHGDLERDYNFFSISPTYYSQGNGNYRDVNQNRRLDLFFEPRVHDRSVRQFMSLIQLDGYNPLVVKGTTFSAGETVDGVITNHVGADDREKVLTFFDTPFTPGELLHFVEDEGIMLMASFEEFLESVLKESLESVDADHGEGFWVDHWTYNLDLIDSFLGVYPDQREQFFTDKVYPFFDTPVSIMPRSSTYRILEGKGLRQYDAIKEDEEKLHGQKDGEISSWVARKEGGRYETDLYSKLVLLAASKTAAIAPYGLGVEMEAGKPGWNDSLNGLPGLVGTSTSELMELKRLVDLLVDEGPYDVTLPSPSVAFIHQLADLAGEPSGDAMTDWDQRATLRETYRSQVTGKPVQSETVVDQATVKERLIALKRLVDESVEAVNGYGELIPTYFYFEAEGELHEDLSKLQLKPVAVTPFLEGIVKKMKVSDRSGAKALYDKVKDSDIYDRKLGMYKTSMSIQGETNEIGRAKAFTPGWLENESIFLHMAYKYHLETLRSGLYTDYYEDIKHALIPFLDADVYGRSTLENSSFIASSANPDESLHGRGYVARLSGSTVEFLHMWLVMMGAERPFTAEDGLTFALSPKLAGSFFTEEGEVSFRLFNQCEVTYSNPSRKDTFGENAVKPVQYTLTYRDGKEELLNAGDVTGPSAEAVRNGSVSAIHVTLA
ncbi:hypothetical protein [Salisediminibacterium selenitireducens]|uniref:Cellobiose phosphorylase n=1 Tax=Bacillus selenitireducens (strain ATCC 700615 / DSM 15326 / MLS10) TaxID=439292 RepID=D6XWM4_BACIE|nr:hypothetical protein [Salisediminibacterium selenitireducens]ADH97866.1 conserved hypothetical protein [[Bacillus] selenitireducens MLS10]